MLFKDRNIYKNKKLLGYSAKDLDNFLHNAKFKNEWVGVSFQIKDGFFKSITNLEIKKFEVLFKSLIGDVKVTDNWFIQPEHPYNLFPWYIKEENNELKKLNNLLIDGYNFKGFIKIDKSHLTNLFEELFIYPKITEAQDLLLFNENIPVVIKFSQHFCMDLISTHQYIIDNAIKEASNLHLNCKIYE